MVWKQEMLPHLEPFGIVDVEINLLSCCSIDTFALIPEQVRVLWRRAKASVEKKTIENYETTFCEHACFSLYFSMRSAYVLARH
jgi:hypothetical protein